MKNTMLPEEELKNLEEVFKAVDVFVKEHGKTIPKIEEETDVYERIHTLMYLDCVSNLIESASTLRGLLEANREEFEKSITKEGKRDPEKFEKMLMLKLLSETLG